MKQGKLLTVLIVIFTFFTPQGIAAADEAAYAEGEVLVLLKGSSVTTFSASQEDAQEVIVSRAKRIGAPVNTVAVKAHSALSTGSGCTFVHMKSETHTTDAMIEGLKNDPDVAGVSKNYANYPNAAPNDARWGDQWGTQLIDAASVWGTAPYADLAGNTVVVFDSGVSYGHDDLKNQLFVFDTVQGSNTAGSHGMWFYRDKSGSQHAVLGNGSAGDVLGHGTHVAGIVAAEVNNGVGVAGVSPKTKILPVNVYSPVYDVNGNITGYKTAYDSDVIRGIDYVLGLRSYLDAKGYPLKAANLSLGSWRRPVNQSLDPFGQAIRRLSNAEVVVVLSAGNEGQDLNNPTGTYTGLLPYPAAFTFKNTLTVGATDRQMKAAYTNYSSSRNLVDLMAPGSGILSTTMDGGYGYMNGSSMAAPMVAGSAALLFSVMPGRCAAEVRSIILSSTNLTVEQSGSRYGVLNAGAANNTLSILNSADQTVASRLWAGNQTIGASGIPVYQAVRILSEDKDGIVQTSSLADADLSLACPYGNVVLNFDLIDTIITGLLAEDEVAYDIVSVPIFEVQDVPPGATVAIPFETPGKPLGSSVANLRVMKVMTDTSGKYFNYVDAPANYADGTYTLLDANGGQLAGDTIASGTQYILVLFIKDNGDYDVNKAAGAIMDPTVVFNVMPVPDPTASGGGGGGGGCSVLPFAGLTLLMPGVLLGRKK